jgi:hypothetical protein
MIAFDNGDEIYAIYCHNDGYPSHNGKILVNHYDDIEKVEELIDLGDLSVLAKEIGRKQDFDQPTDRNWCLAYGRDRGEEGTEARKYISLIEATMDFSECDYFYLFDGRSWLYKRNGVKQWDELTEELCK